jgi:hypothetical protein
MYFMLTVLKYYKIVFCVVLYRLDTKVRGGRRGYGTFETLFLLK